MHKLKQALSLHQQGQLAPAAALYREVLAGIPNHADALHFLGVLESQRGNSDVGLPLIDRAIAANPNNVAALYNRANVLRDLERFSDSLAGYDRVLALKADHVPALNNRGVVLHNLGRLNEALVSYSRALGLKPDHVDVLTNLGNAHVELKQFDEALSSYDRALAIAPHDAAAHFGRGNAFIGLGRFDDALQSYDRALKAAPDEARVLNNRGNALERLSRLDEALVCYDRVVRLDPKHAEALHNRGNLLIQLKRYGEALESYERALATRPEYPDALYGRGYALMELKRYDDAIAAFEQLLAARADYPYALGMMLHAKRTACDWRDASTLVSQTVRAVREGKRAVTPLAFLAVSDSAEDNARCARIVIGDKYGSAPQPMWRGERYRHERIRVAYVSADFNMHAVATQMAGVFERHDRRAFETIAISHGLDDKSEMRSRLERAFDRFVDVRNRSDRDIAALLRQEEVDIAVDLTGLTGRSRPGIFAFRPAGLQAQHLGFPGTMGADFIDYVIADRVVIPENEERHYSEKVVTLPDSYLPTDPSRGIAQAPSRAQAGLPEPGFVFCSFNNGYKFSPELFDVWMRLLKGTEGAVLWLPDANDAARRNLAREARTRGVDPARLLFAAYETRAEDHLARLSLADLFLDTLPYNAHSTACDALWAGLPVLTCRGHSFAGRVAASQLQAAGLSELITDTLESYERVAMTLAGDAAMLQTIRTRLAQIRRQCPLFDADLFARHLEAAYAQMYERHRRGLPPQSFSVARVGTS